MDASSRAVYRGQVTKLVKSAVDYLQFPEAQVTEANTSSLDAAEEELTVLLERLSVARDNLNQANSALRTTIKPEEYDRENESIVDYEDKAVGMISRLKVRIAKLREKRVECSLTPRDGNVLHQVSRQNVTQLQKLALRKFSGDYKDWLPFWEQFKAAVHENPSVSAPEKFSYLQSVLVGKAAQTIEGFTPTQACYDWAIALLLEEYGDKNKMIDRYMQQLMATKHVSNRQDCVGLCRLYNSIVSSTRSLTALGVPSNHYSIMLKTILLKSLPNDLRVDLYRLHKDVPGIAHGSDIVSEGVNSNESEGEITEFSGDKQVHALLSYLKTEVESLEKSLEISAKSEKLSRSCNTATSLFTTNQSTSCFFCNSVNHATAQCNSAMSVLDRKQKLRKARRCFRCTMPGHVAKNCRVKGILCSKCNGNHVASVCDPNYKAKLTGFSPSKRQTLKNVGSSGIAVNNTINESDASNTLNLCSSNVTQLHTTKVFLQTACGVISTPENVASLFVRIVLDGGSQRTYIKQSISQRLNLPVVGTERIRVVAFGSECGAPVQIMNIVQMRLTSQYDISKYILIRALEIPEICMDVLLVPREEETIFSNLQLADGRTFGSPESGISLLVGSDYYWKIVTGTIKRLSKNLTAIHSLLGWTVQGPAVELDFNAVINDSNNIMLCTANFYDDNNNFWSLETLGILQDNTTANLNYDSYITKKGQRYEAKLLWKENDFVPDSNRESSLLRFHALIRKLSKEPARLFSYDKAMWDYISRGVAEKVVSKRTDKVYFMPHRAVIRNDKSTTQIRIVFDASAKTGRTHSLNDILSAGPNLLPELLSILLNFHLRSIGLVADIQKAFLQISLQDQDRDFHRFIWFEEELDDILQLPPIQEYRMTRVTIGVKCSPYLLGAAIKHHLNTYKCKSSQICVLLSQSFYIDDLVLSIDDEQLASEICKEATSIMLEASMLLQKWNCNAKDVRDKLKGDLPLHQKVLGVHWFVLKDEIAVDMESTIAFTRETISSVTKRNILMCLGRIFDPLGILAPFVVQIKIIFQQCWKYKLQWDEQAPEEINKRWQKICKELPLLKGFYIPRHVTDRLTCSIQLHLFSDASPQAFGTVAYLRCTNSNGQSIVKLLCSKGRVSPITKDGGKKLTLPKLELTAALISARLKKYLLHSLRIQIDRVILWSDSKITLCWIRNPPSKGEQYVSARVNEILYLTEINQWFHCPGTSNPADLLTRGISAEQLTTAAIWLNGPSWLAENEVNWPSHIESSFLSAELVVGNDLKEDDKKNTQLLPLLEISTFSSYKRLLRVTAYILRFIANIRTNEKVKMKGLKTNEIISAELYWIQYIQSIEYEHELRSLKRNGSISLSSKLLTLHPKIGNDGVLRATSRLQNLENEAYDTLFPILLPKRSYLTKLLILDIHERTLHSGVNTVLARMREKFWIPQGRQLVKTLLKRCLVCQRLKSKPHSPPFASLPKHRLNASRPFETTGIDIAGPLYVRSSSPNAPTRKVYILLMTCAVVRAIHLELVFGLSAEACLMGLRCFISRRGVPVTIISDNAKNFKRMSAELAEFGDFLQSESYKDFISENRIKWMFIVERAPWWGGFYERLVRSVKEVLRLTIWRKTLTSDELNTYLIEAENVINSRPLTYIGDDPQDPTPLTPAHFLTGPIIKNFVSGLSTSSDSDIRELWRHRFRISQKFWKRWKLEYIHQLRSAHHYKHGAPCQYRIGDVVLVHDDSLPRIMWRLAVIENIFPGRDGKLRACEIRLHNGTRLRRSVQHLYPLEISSSTHP